MKKLNFKLASFLILISLSLASCTSTKTALFDQYSYQKTTEIKVETIQLLNQANTPFTTQKEKVQSLLLNIEKLTEYEKNKPNNEITFAMWQVLNDKEKNLLAGFFKIWEKKGIVSPVFQEESKKQISDALDLLIQYEIKKDKESKELLLDLINLNS
ncbi:hypothetical protein [Flavobacterium hungaricum]|uniref:Lipoprotein n=1 Tax=Flavobacterium hungaricum TaxID=2082725 RepID=A0ABR9TK96_9FLAO|nr:hypothetical protein [Flavobacterium hungaricum]MBE8725791.1 hypothetical protein [Flavobacterium hungaricum]